MELHTSLYCYNTRQQILILDHTAACNCPMRLQHDILLIALSQYLFYKSIMTQEVNIIFKLNAFIWLSFLKIHRHREHDLLNPLGILSACFVNLDSLV